MSDHRQIHDINQRRQLWSRIDNLKSSCEDLAQMKKNLADRLFTLNNVAEKLIDEKKSGKFNSNLELDWLYPNESTLFLTSIRETTMAQTKYNHNDNSANEDQSLLPENHPSDAFKIKLSHCLKEILSKANEILKLSEQVNPNE